MYRQARLRWVLGVCAVLLAVAAVQPALARIKLVTLPVRERVEIQLNNANATLVEEERIVTLLKGTNHVDFSWSNTAIDKGTIHIEAFANQLSATVDGDFAHIIRAAVCNWATISIAISVLATASVHVEATWKVDSPPR